MKKILVLGIVVLALCFAGCGDGAGDGGGDGLGSGGTISTPPSSPAGAPAGVYVPTDGADAGKLIIFAPAYTINPDTGAVITATGTDTVEANIKAVGVSTIVSTTGTISGNMLAIVIPEPASGFLKTAEEYFGYNLSSPPENFTEGKNIKIGGLNINPSSGVMALYDNPVFTKIQYDGDDFWDIFSDGYGYLYSEGTVTILYSGTVVKSGFTYTMNVDIKLVKGWNCFMLVEKKTGPTTGTVTYISKAPPAGAKWVLKSKSLGMWM